MQERITELEVKVAFQEKLIADLDDVIRELREQVDRLERDVRELREQGAGQVEKTTLEDDKPPHY